MGLTQQSLFPFRVSLIDDTLICDLNFVHKTTVSHWMATTTLIISARTAAALHNRGGMHVTTPYLLTAEIQLVHSFIIILLHHVCLKELTHVISVAVRDHPFLYLTLMQLQVEVQASIH